MRAALAWFPGLDEEGYPTKFPSSVPEWESDPGLMSCFTKAGHSLFYFDLAKKWCVSELALGLGMPCSSDHVKL